MWAFESTVQIALQGLSLLLIFLEIPIAFDACGEESGVSFTWLLAAFHFVLSTLRLLLRNTSLQPVASTLFYLQFLLLPSMLTLHVGRCNDSVNESTVTYIWRIAMQYATGPFALLEGFCTLIVIQAFGRLSNMLSQYSDLMTLGQLFFAALCLSVDFFLLQRIYEIPSVLDVSSATLVGAALTIALALGTYGIISRKGNTTESALLVSYVVYVIYLSFTDFQSSYASNTVFPFASSAEAVLPPSTCEPEAVGLLEMLGGHLQNLPFLKSTLATSAAQATAAGAARVAKAARAGAISYSRFLGNTTPSHDLPLLPADILDGYANLMTKLAENTPGALKFIFEFFVAAVQAITPSVLVSLIFRLSVFFVALRIIPYIRHPDHKNISVRSNPVFFALYSYAPCIIIAVYTHLLMQHFGGIVHVPKNVRETPIFEILNVRNVFLSSRAAWKFWNWVSIFATLAVYGYELVSGLPRTVSATQIADS